MHEEANEECPLSTHLPTLQDSRTDTGETRDNCSDGLDFPTRLAPL